MTALTVYMLAGLLAEPGGRYAIYGFEDLRPGPARRPRASAEPLEGRVRITRTNRGVLVDGDVHGDRAGTCCRCLAASRSRPDVEIHEEVLPVVDLATGAPLDHAEVSRRSPG